MIAIDTNVLIRIIVKDNEIQAKKALNLIKKSGEVFISNVVLCETIWVLESCYSLNKAKLSSTIETILRVNQFNLETPEAIWLALNEYQHSQCDLTDCVIGAVSHYHGNTAVVTFDKEASKSAFFEILK